jgi:hypothetical protein
MAKATLTFDLNDIDDKQAHLRCVKSLDMALAIFEFTYNTKKSFQYNLDESDDKSYELLDKVYERFWEILNENNIKIDELVS